jgi:hypothetical protein
MYNPASSTDLRWFNGSDLMVLDASGNLGVGTTTPGTRLHITGSNGLFAQFLNSANNTGEGIAIGSGTNLGRISTNGASTAMAFEINAVEKARITSGGELVVGGTSPQGLITAQGDASIFGNLNSNATVGSGTRYHAVWYENGTERGSVTSNGSATAYNTSSDARLKENIAPADDSASLVDAIQVRKFDWKSNGSHQRYGMIAQELDAVFPEAVTKSEDPERMMAVDYSKLVPMLVKEIQSLRARVAALEGT